MDRFSVPITILLIREDYDYGGEVITVSDGNGEEPVCSGLRDSSRIDALGQTRLYGYSLSRNVSTE